MITGRYSTGSEQHPDSSANNRVGTFATGIARDEVALPVGRFSTGMEQHPASPATNRFGSFATGIAREEFMTPVVELVRERRLPPTARAA